MLLQVPSVLTADELRALRTQLATATFVDGRATAGSLLHEIKRNEQVASDDAVMVEVTRSVLAALKRNDAFRLATYPNQLHGLMVARYRPGMAYGLHVDEALMGGERVYRCDLSLTLFLSTPDEYDGGELELHTGVGVAQSKLAAGDLIAYGTGDVHQVRPVTRGERLVVVAWIQSFVRDEGIRAMLWDLAQARLQVLQREGRSDTFELLNKTHANLLRRFAEV